MSTTETYEVRGMTCGHCVSAVTDEVRALAGVDDVAVELESGRLVVTSSRPIEREEIRAAVDEAGYELAPTA